MIFQEPMTALDPVYTIGAQIEETIVRHEGVSHKAARARALELLDLVQIPSPARRLGAYPHEMSGGMRQRAMIALALSCRPSILLADEPTTALDVTVQIQIILLLRRLQRELGMAVIFVTHDVGVSVEIADRLAVMYAGRFVETGPTEAVIRQPRHPYTEGLLGSTVTTARGQRLPAIPGAPPDLRALPPGCAFAPRCRYAEERCVADVPPQHRVAPDHTTRCVLAQEAEKAHLLRWRPRPPLNVTRETSGRRTFVCGAQTWPRTPLRDYASRAAFGRRLAVWTFSASCGRLRALATAAASGLPWVALATPDPTAGEMNDDHRIAADVDRGRARPSRLAGTVAFA